MQEENDTASDHPAGAWAYAFTVRDLQTIRFQNFRFLLEELEEELGQKRGVLRRLSTISGVPPSLLSMLAGGALHSGSGKPRQIGDDTARKLEVGMSKEPNWMDVDRESARDHKEAAALDKWRTLSDDDKAVIMQMMDALMIKWKPPTNPPESRPPAP